MKNVVIFTVDDARYAVELRWVREVLTLGYVTPVPGAPTPLLGATNVHGSIVPVIGLGDSTQLGPSALLLEAEDLSAALPVSAVDEVVTAESSDDESVVDSKGRKVALVSPPDLLANAQTQVATTPPRAERE